MNEDLGRLAYQTYCKAVGYKSVRGDDLPVWQDQTQHLRDAWTTAAAAVLNAAVDVDLRMVNDS